VEALIEFMDFMMSAKEGIVLNCGRNLFNALIASQLLLLSMTKFSAFMVACHQNSTIYNRSIKF
jgi:hypothetical protein